MEIMNFHAIVHAKETQLIYIYMYFLISKDPFLKLFSLATMLCVHW